MGGVVRRRESQRFIGHQRGACTVCTVCQCVSLGRASGRSVVGRERHRLWPGAGSGWGRLRVSAWTPFVSRVFSKLGLARTWLESGLV